MGGDYKPPPPGLLIQVKNDVPTSSYTAPWNANFWESSYP